MARGLGNKSMVTQLAEHVNFPILQKNNSMLWIKYYIQNVEINLHKRWPKLF